MNATCYPDVHIFLLHCSKAGDFNSQVKLCFQKNDPYLAESLAEELEKLSQSLSQLKNVPAFILALDPETLNYIFDDNFLKKYRAVNDFIKNMDALKFERLCAYYLSLLGCDNIKVTRHANDQGLDFYGTHPFNETSFFETVSEKIFLIGQAKLYTTKVGTAEIREFVGSLELRQLAMNNLPLLECKT